MELFTRTWRYLFVEPLSWVVSCFFQPLRFQKDIDLPGSFQWRRVVPMLRTSLPLLLCFLPLFCCVIAIDMQIHAGEIDLPTLFSLCLWFFFGCLFMGIVGGFCLGIARGITLALVWNISYTLAVLFTSLVLTENTFLVMMFAFGIVGGIVFGTAFGTNNDLLGDITSCGVWTLGIFLIRMSFAQPWGITDLIFPFVLVGCLTGSLLWFLTGNRSSFRGGRATRKSLIWGNIWGIAICILLGVLANASTSATSSVSILVLFAYALFCFFGAALYVIGYHRLLLYPFSCISSFRASLDSLFQPSQVFASLHRSSLYWDEYVFFPLPGLKQTLLIAAQQEEGKQKVMEEIAFILADRPQQNRIAQAVSQELALHDLEARKDLRAISLASHQLQIFLPEEVAFINDQWLQPFIPFLDASHDAEGSLRSLSRKAKQRALQRMTTSLRRVGLDPSARKSELEKRLYDVMRFWLVVAEQEQARLERVSFANEQIDNPFSPGVVLKAQTPLFVGRRDLVQALEEALSRGDRRPTFLLNGERRMGKSSILYQLSVMLGPHYIPLFYDLQKPGIFSSTITFLMSIAREIDKGLRSRGIRVEKLEYARLQEADTKNEEAVYLLFTEWLQVVEKRLEQEDKILLLTLDEFEGFLDVQESPSLHLGLLLQLFHSIAQNHPHVALLFSGARTFSEMGSGWATHFTTPQILRVSFLRPDEARELITQPGDPDFSVQHPFSEEVVKEIIRLTACHPLLVQAVCSALIALLNSKTRTQGSIADVESVIDQVLNTWEDSYFRDQWLQADEDQKKCLLALAPLDECSPFVVAQESGLSNQATGSALQRLVRRDLVLSEHDAYRLAVPLFHIWMRRHRSLLVLELGDFSPHQHDDHSSPSLLSPSEPREATMLLSEQKEVAMLPSEPPGIVHPSSSFSERLPTPVPLPQFQVPPPSPHRMPRRLFVVGGVMGGLTVLGIGLARVIALFPFKSVRPSPQTPTPIGTLLSTYHGPAANIRVLAWSPDNRRLAAGSDDYTVHVWDIATGKHTLIYRGHHYFVEGVAWSPDSKRLASGSADTTVQVWDSSDGSLLYTYRGHRLWVNRISWSPDGKYIVSGEQRGIAGHPVQVRVWEASTGKTVMVYDGHMNGVFAVAWSPDSTRVASCGYDGVLQIWEGMTGRLIATCRDNVANFGLSWSPDGQRLAVACSDSLVRIVEANTGELSYAYHGHRQAAEDVAWSPDGTSLASSGADAVVHVFHAATGRTLFTFQKQPDPLAAVVWSPDGKRIASGCDDGTVQIWYAHL